MSLLKLVIFAAAIITGNASGIGHLVPAVKSFPIVRYAPFYNFPGGVRSIHAVAPAVSPAPFLPASAPVAPAFAPTPVFPASLAPQAYTPAPAPVFAPAPLPAPAPVFGPAPVFAPAPHFGPAPYFAPAPHFAPAAFAPAPVLPKLAPVIPSLPPLAARAVLSAAPFAPVIRPVAPALPPPVFAPATFAVAKAFPINARFLAPAPVLPAPFLKQVAWK